MNCFEILMIVYFVVGTIAELVVFNPFVKNKEQLENYEIIKFQLTIWSWPILIVLGSFLGISYLGLIILIKMFDLVFPENS